MKQKRILTVQDISCVGKCSLTVALPILSAFDLETAILPTAVLSTHTGGFTGYTFRDLTEDILPIADHWQKEGIDFKAIYTGYLGQKQVPVILELFRRFKGNDTLLFCDPAMADNGKLYAGFPESFPSEMKKVCAAADLIVPNLTEACLMLGKPFPGNNYDEAYIRSTLKELTAFGCPVAILTGVRYGDGKQGAVAYDSKSGIFCSAFDEDLPVSYHGTGDVFSSALCGALVKGFELQKALEIAVRFTVDAIRVSAADPLCPKYGVRFESVLNELTSLNGDRE